MVLPFWYQLTQVVLEKRPLNGCSSSSSSNKSTTMATSLSTTLSYLRRRRKLARHRWATERRHCHTATMLHRRMCSTANHCSQLSDQPCRSAWNSLPTELRLLRSTSTFCRRLKTFPLDPAYGHREIDWRLFCDVCPQSPSRGHNTNDSVTVVTDNGVCGADAAVFVLNCSGRYWYFTVFWIYCPLLHTACFYSGVLFRRPIKTYLFACYYPASSALGVLNDYVLYRSMHSLAHSLCISLVCFAGFATIPSGGGGTLFGGYLVKQLNLQCRGIFRLCLVTTGTVLVLTLTLLARCENMPFAGVNVDYAMRNKWGVVCCWCRIWQLNCDELVSVVKPVVWQWLH